MFQINAVIFLFFCIQLEEEKRKKKEEAARKKQEQEVRKDDVLPDCVAGFKTFLTI